MWKTTDEKRGKTVKLGKNGKNRLKIKVKAEILAKENFSKMMKSAEKRNSNTPVHAQFIHIHFDTLSLHISQPAIVALDLLIHHTTQKWVWIFPVKVKGVIYT